MIYFSSLKPPLDCNISWDPHRNRYYFGYDLYMLNDITINIDGIPLCPKGFPMKQAAVETKKGQIKYRCPKITCKGDTPHCTCENPCSDAKYSRNVHLVMKDNPRLFSNPPRDSIEWKLEYNARISAERCNKREKID